METTPKQTAKQLLEELLIKALIEFDGIESNEQEENIIRLNIVTSEPAMIIGRRGETLFAIQQLLRMIAQKSIGRDFQLVLDVDDYRKNQERNAELIARDIAKRVQRTGEAEELAPMPSYKRRAVHTFFAQPEYADLNVFSVGEGDDRRIRIENQAENQEPKMVKEIDSPLF